MVATQSLKIEPLKIAIVGAGAIGGFLGARLAQAGHAVSMLARDRTLAALQREGLRLEAGDERLTVSVNAAASCDALGAQDVVIIAVKAGALPQLAGTLAPLLKADTVVLPALNGVPWWYFFDTRVSMAGTRLRSVDPDGLIEASIALQRVMGIVVFASCSSPEPGLVRQAPNPRLVLGEPAGGGSARVQGLTDLFTQAQLPTQSSADIRNDIWMKLLGNACFNPVSLITGAYTDDMINRPEVKRLFTAMMQETLAVGRALGLSVDIDPAARMAQTLKLGHIKTSMLQDFEQGRPVELDAILGALVECAQAANVAVPLAETILALARMRAQTSVRGAA